MLELSQTSASARLRPLLSAVLTLLLTVTVATTQVFAVPPPTATDQAIGKIVALLIARSHYSRKPLDDKVSTQLYDEYFSRLDPNRTYFLATDLEHFSSYRLVLDNLLLDGNVNFAYEVYERFLQRVDERMVYIRNRLQQPFDFTIDESVLVDRSKAPWAASTAELDEIWRLRLKNSLLTYKLMQANKNSEAVDAFVSSKTPAQQVLQRYERFSNQLQNRSSTEILEVFLSSLTLTYDPHSLYMAPDTEEDFDISMSLSLQGIGAVLTVEDEMVKVVEVIPGGPADLDGRLHANDRIVAVAQENEEAVDVIGLPLRKVVRMIRGAKTSRVFLTVIDAKKGLGSVPKIIDIVRDEVKLTEQEAKLSTHNVPLSDAVADAKAAGKVAVISLPSFYSDFAGRRDGKKDYKSASRDVRNLIEQAERAGADGIILDLRTNGGGSLDEAVDLAGLFFRAGPVVQVRQAQGDIRVLRSSNARAFYQGPLVVLVSHYSASASEIVAAALQDHRRAIVVGDRLTHGKGTVQNLRHLDEYFRFSPQMKDVAVGSLKCTVAKFYRINGGSTQNKGVNPDIILESFADHMQLGERYLPHVLPWDSINALPVKPEIDVHPYLPVVRQRSEQRLAQNDSYQLLRQEIQRFAERRQQKTLPLEKNQRLALQKEDELWAQRIRQLTGRSSPAELENELATETDTVAPDADAADLVLNEALLVMADLICMQAYGQNLTAAAPPPDEDRQVLETQLPAP